MSFVNKSKEYLIESALTCALVAMEMIGVLISMQFCICF